MLRFYKLFTRRLLLEALSKCVCYTCITYYYYHYILLFTN